MATRYFNLTYEEFKRHNDESKRFFSSLGRVRNVSLTFGTCDLTYEDNTTKNIPIMTIVNNIVYDGMGAISNPSALKNWSGWRKA